MNVRRRIWCSGCGSVVLLAMFIAQAGAIPEQLRQMKDMEAAQKKEGDPVISVPEVQYKGAGLREPFVPVYEEAANARSKNTGQGVPVEAVITPPSMTISGLMWGGSIPQAVINGKVVREGDTLLGATIEQISQAGVKISFQGKTFTVSSPAAAAAKTSIQATQGGK